MMQLVNHLVKFMTGRKEIVIVSNGGSSSSTTTIHVRDCEPRRAPGGFR